MEHLLQNCPYQIFNIQNVIWNEKIGEGVHSNVYQGQLNNKIYAFKEYSFDFPIDYDNLLYELNLLKKLNHCKYCIYIYGICHTQENIYLIMDLGTDLSSYIENKKFRSHYSRGKPINNYFQYNYKKDIHWCYIMPEKEKVKYTKMLIESVDELHNQEIIHSDIKLENIIIHNKIIKLIDFGVSYMMNGKKCILINTTYGTEGYMAPEQYKGLLTYKTDIYSLGVSLIELWVGNLWEDSEGFRPCRNEVLKSLRKIEKNNINFSKILRKCISLDEKKRYTSKNLLNKINQIF